MSILTVLSFILKIIAALFVFGIIILVHEGGHFLAAKWNKVRVNEFAIGMGPTLLKWGKGETTYSLRLIPMGGFCAMEGEDEGTPLPSALGANDTPTKPLPSTDALETDVREETPSEEDTQTASSSGSFADKKVWQRITIVVAGAIMNLVLGFILLLCYNLFCTSGQYILAYLSCTNTVASVDEAFDVPIQKGDTLLTMNGERLYSYMDFVTFLQTDEDGIFDIEVERPVSNDKTETVLFEDVDFNLTVDEETGARYLNYNMHFYTYHPEWNTIVQQTAKQEFSLMVHTWRSLKYMLQGRFSMNDLSGPIGAIDMIGEAVENAVQEEERSIGIGYLLFLVALLTINIGLMNLLPLPALDGGRLIFLLWEGITRRPIPAKYETYVHAAGMILLVLLMVVVAFSDILKLF